MGFKIVSRKTAKTLARCTSVSNTSWSSESPRVKPGHVWASSCCFPFLSAENYIPHLDIHHRCASSFVGGCFHIVFLLSVTLLYFVVSPDNLFFFHFREYFLVFFTCTDIANQLLIRHSPLAPLGQVDELTAKPSRFSIQVVCWSFLELWRLKRQKICIADRQ